MHIHHDSESSPNGTPKDIQDALDALKSNVEDIVSNLRAIRGEDYTNRVIHYFGMLVNSYQLEELACETCSFARVLIEEHESDHENIEDLRAAASSKHDTVHSLASAINHAISSAVSMEETDSKNAGMTEDIGTLLGRVNIDWKSKGF